MRGTDPGSAIVSARGWAQTNLQKSSTGGLRNAQIFYD